VAPSQSNGGLYDRLAKWKFSKQIEQSERSSRLVQRLVGVAEHLDTSHDGNECSFSCPRLGTSRSGRGKNVVETVDENITVEEVHTSTISTLKMCGGPLPAIQAIPLITQLLDFSFDFLERLIRSPRTSGLLKYPSHLFAVMRFRLRIQNANLHVVAARVRLIIDPFELAVFINGLVGRHDNSFVVSK
jgi:hypothetical protein